jgi:RNA-directed DNA polymerase
LHKGEIFMNTNQAKSDSNIGALVNRSAKTLESEWYSIDWTKAEHEVNRMQTKIAKASSENKWSLVKKLQYQLVTSFYARAVAVKRVTTNKGKRTAGVDGEKWESATDKMMAVKLLTKAGYNTKPLKRVYIDKPGKKEKRPLSIPTMHDRTMQALYLLSLEPISETLADTKSFGFRRGRCAQDACEFLFARLCRKDAPQWILEGDIKGCFDHISHDWLINNVPMDKEILAKFLNAGFIDTNKLFPTIEGTPQGGIISPTLANMTLDCMQKMIEEKYWKFDKRTGEYRSNRKADFNSNLHKVNFCRYADDFVILGDSPEILEMVKKDIDKFLNIRGLQLSESKTIITSISAGFDFLGWNFCKRKEKLIIMPSQKSIAKVKRTLSDIVKKLHTASQNVVITELNQIITGWANYHQSVCSKETFSDLDNELWHMLWKWATRIHKNKNKHWIKNRYWHRVNGRDWTFCIINSDNNITDKLKRFSDKRIVRHTQLSVEKSPFLDKEYFEERRINLTAKKISGGFQKVWLRQQGKCYFCNDIIDITSQEYEVHHIIPREKGGKNTYDNLAYAHASCHKFYERKIRTKLVVV